MEKERVIALVILLTSIATAYFTGTVKNLIVAASTIAIILGTAIIFKKKFSYEHPLFYSVFEAFARQSFYFILIIYIVYEIIPPESELYGVSLRKAFISIIIVAISIKIGGYIERASSSKTDSDGHQKVLLGKSLKYSFITIVFIIVLRYLDAGGEIKNIIIAGGFFSIVLGLAAQSTLSNIIAGFLIIAEKPFSVGDIIEIENVLGEVVDIKLMSTHVRTIDNKLVRIPNSKVFENDIVNYKKNRILTIRDSISISYSSDVILAKKVILETLDSIPYVLKYPRPFAEVSQLGDSGVEIEFWYSVPTTDFVKKRMQVLTKIYEHVKKAGIEIPFPQRVNWFANELKIKLEKDFTSDQRE